MESLNCHLLHKSPVCPRILLLTPCDDQMLEALSTVFTVYYMFLIQELGGDLLKINSMLQFSHFGRQEICKCIWHCFCAVLFLQNYGNAELALLKVSTLTLYTEKKVQYAQVLFRNVHRYS
jgi:hypothetical protein